MENYEKMFADFYKKDFNKFVELKKEEEFINSQLSIYEDENDKKLICNYKILQQIFNQFCNHKKVKSIDISTNIELLRLIHENYVLLSDYHENQSIELNKQILKNELEILKIIQ